MATHATGASGHTRGSAAKAAHVVVAPVALVHAATAPAAGHEGMVHAPGGAGAGAAADGTASGTTSTMAAAAGQSAKAATVTAARVTARACHCPLAGKRWPGNGWSAGQGWRSMQHCWHCE